LLPTYATGKVTVGVKKKGRAGEKAGNIPENGSDLQPIHGRKALEGTAGPSVWREREKGEARQLSSKKSVAPYALRKEGTDVGAIGEGMCNYLSLGEEKQAYEKRKDDPRGAQWSDASERCH